MSKVQEAGLLEALGDAEGLARVIRAMSDGRLDLVPVATHATISSGLMSWEAARTEARHIAGTMGKSAAHAPQVANYDEAVQQAMAETFCSTCGPLGEPGVHTQRDCPRYDHAQRAADDGHRSWPVPRCPRCHTADRGAREFVKVTETRGRMRCPHPWHESERAPTSQPEGK
jgi:hypothetical protein